MTIVVDYRILRCNPMQRDVLRGSRIRSATRRLFPILAALTSACAGPQMITQIRLPGLTPTHVNKQVIRSGDWKLKIATGKFSGDVRCHLADSKHHIVYAAGAVGFRFRHHLNTLGAWMSVDGAPPQRWQDNLPELTRLGVPMDGASLDNPTDSIVWVPASQLAQADRITIQPRENSAPHLFPLHGFTSLRDLARNMGCSPEGRFVP